MGDSDVIGDLLTLWEQEMLHYYLQMVVVVKSAHRKSEFLGGLTNHLVKISDPALQLVSPINIYCPLYGVPPLDI